MLMTLLINEKLRQFDLVNLDLLKEAGRHLVPVLDDVLGKFYERAIAGGETAIYSPALVRSILHAMHKRSIGRCCFPEISALNTSHQPNGSDARMPV